MDVYLKLILWILLQRLKMRGKITNFEIWSRQNYPQLCKQYRDGHVLAMFWYCWTTGLCVCDAWTFYPQCFKCDC